VKREREYFCAASSGALTRPSGRAQMFNVKAESFLQVGPVPRSHVSAKLKFNS
jgi:hypothetical protein